MLGIILYLSHIGDYLHTNLTCRDITELSFKASTIQYYTEFPSLMKFTQLMETGDGLVLNVGMFLAKAYKLRNAKYMYFFHE